MSAIIESYDNELNWNFEYEIVKILQSKNDSFISYLNILLINFYKKKIEILFWSYCIFFILISIFYFSPWISNFCSLWPACFQNVISILLRSYLFIFVCQKFRYIYFQKIEFKIINVEGAWIIIKDFFLKEIIKELFNTQICLHVYEKIYGRWCVDFDHPILLLAHT